MRKNLHLFFLLKDYNLNISHFNFCSQFKNMKSFFQNCHHNTLMFWLSLALLTNISCQLNKNSSEVITLFINPEKATESLIEQLSDDIKIIPLYIPDSIALGNIESIRRHGEYFLLHDGQYTNTITLVDKDGKYISSLNRTGRGPGEYTSCNNFAVLAHKDQVIINDRGVKNLKYSLPEFTFIEEKAENKLLMSMEYFDYHLLTISDSPLNKKEFIGIEWLNLYNKTYLRPQLPNNPASIDLSYQNTLTKSPDGILYCSPGHITKVYHLTPIQINILAQIDFGSHKLSREVWDIDDPNYFETKFFESDKATWANLAVNHKNQLSFFYVFGQKMETILALCNLENNTCTNYSNIFLTKEGTALPPPISVVDNYYTLIIYPEQMKDIFPNVSKTSSDWQNHILQAKQNKQPVLLMFSVI